MDFCLVDLGTTKLVLFFAVEVSILKRICFTLLAIFYCQMIKLSPASLL